MTDQYLQGQQPLPEVPDDRHHLTRRELLEVTDTLPQGMQGFLTRWGLLQYGQKVCEALSRKDKQLAATYTPDPCRSVEDDMEALSRLAAHLVVDVMRECDGTPAADTAQSMWRLLHDLGLHHMRAPIAQKGASDSRQGDGRQTIAKTSPLVIDALAPTR